MLLSYFLEVQGVKLGDIGDAILKLAKTTKDACAVSFQSIFLLADAEFYGKPIDGCKLKQF